MWPNFFYLRGSVFLFQIFFARILVVSVIFQGALLVLAIHKNAARLFSGQKTVGHESVQDMLKHNAVSKNAHLCFEKAHALTCTSCHVHLFLPAF